MPNKSLKKTDKDEELWVYNGWAECPHAEADADNGGKPCTEAYKCDGHTWEFHEKFHPATTFTKCCVVEKSAFEVHLPAARGLKFCHWAYCRYIDADDQVDCGENCHCLGRVVVEEVDTGMVLKICPQDGFDNDKDPTMVTITPEMIDFSVEEDYESAIENEDEDEDEITEELPYPTDSDFDDASAEFDTLMGERTATVMPESEAPYKFIKWDTCVPTPHCGWTLGVCQHASCIICFDTINHVRVSLCAHDVLEAEIDDYESYEKYMHDHHASGYKTNGSGQDSMIDRYRARQSLLQTHTSRYVQPKPKIKVMFFERTNPTPDIKPTEA
jgi:hypothetical protein